jgi:hypothetical protein
MTGWWWFGTWLLFFRIYGILWDNPSHLTNSYFSRWLKPPTSDD